MLISVSRILISAADVFVSPRLRHDSCPRWFPLVKNDFRELRVVENERSGLELRQMRLSRVAQFMNAAMDGWHGSSRKIRRQL